MNVGALYDLWESSLSQNPKLEGTGQGLGKPPISLVAMTKKLEGT